MRDVTEMSTRELRKEIRSITADINADIADYRERGKETRYTNEMIERATLRAGTKSRRGEIGLGLSRKLKGALQVQLAGLRRLKKEFDRPKERAEKEVSGYKSFVKRFGHITHGQYQDFIDMADIIKSELEGWGYEDFGGSIAQAYADSNDKINFVDYLKEAKKRAAGGTPEDVVDRLKDVLKENGTL